MHMQLPAAARSKATTDQLTIAESLFLTAGAAVGLWQVTAATQELSFLHKPAEFGWSGGVLIFYAVLSGMTMAAVLLMIRAQLHQRRTWPPAAIVLFAAGLLAWCLLPLATNGFVLNAETHRPLDWELERFAAYDPGAFTLAGCFHLWPLVSFGLLLVCGLSGAAAPWWMLRGWWAEWLGMWTLVAWSAPLALTACRFVGGQFLEIHR